MDSIKIITSNKQEFIFNAKLKKSYINDTSSKVVDWILLDNKELWAIHPKIIDNMVHMDEDNISNQLVASLMEEDCSDIVIICSTWTNLSRLKTNKNLYYFPATNKKIKNFTQSISFVDNAIVSIPLDKGLFNNFLIPIFVDKKVKNKNNLIVYKKLMTYFSEDKLQNFQGEYLLHNLIKGYMIIDGYKIKMDKHLINDMLDLASYKIYKKEKYILIDFNKFVIIYSYDEKKQNYKNARKVFVYPESWNFNGHKIFSQTNLPEKIEFPKKHDDETIIFIYPERKEKVIYSKTSEKIVKITN